MSNKKIYDGDQFLVKALILHGGAGKWGLSSPERREKAKKVVEECTRRGWVVLEERNDAVEAVVESIKCMEDSGVLNAGWGSVLDLLGGRGLDAGIMSSNGLLGAVGDVKATRNVIELARIVAVETPHILVVGEGADELARVKGLPPLPPPPERIVRLYREYLRKLVGRESSPFSYVEAMRKFLEFNPGYLELLKKIIAVYDTVGACAVDDNGVLVAGVSTGGLLLKFPGRVGDSAIPGAGFYATDNIACSATGIGEKIIETMPCKQLDIEYVETKDLNKASDKVLEYTNKTVGRDSLGFIAVDREGNIAWRYNTEAMLIGYVKNDKVYVELRI